MNSTLITFITMIGFLLSQTSVVAQCHGRYQEEIFDSTIVTEIMFGENVNSSGQLQSLYMDVYEPYGDTDEERPLLLLAHGGAFLDVVDHKSTDIVRMCEIFTKMGYVCASYDYREEANPVSLAFPDKMIKAVFRAVQDGKAAIRYFKRSAEEGNPYSIDPDQIILGGVSAGGLLAVNLVYVTNENMLPWLWDIWLQQVGGLEGNTGSPGYNTDVIGIINVSGAIGKPAWMAGNNIPLLNIHGTEDPIVPYGVGRPLGVPTLPNIFGSKFIHEHATQRGIPSTLITYEGFGHVPFFNLDDLSSWGDTMTIEGNLFNEEVWDSTIRHITTFAYSVLDCNPDNQIITGIDDHVIENVSIYPNPSSGRLHLSVPESLSNGNVEIYGMDGSFLKKIKLNGVELETKLSLPSGLYSIIVYDEAKHDSFIHRNWMVLN